MFRVVVWWLWSRMFKEEEEEDSRCKWGCYIGIASWTLVLPKMDGPGLVCFLENSSQLNFADSNSLFSKFINKRKSGGLEGKVSLLLRDT